MRYVGFDHELANYLQHMSAPPRASPSKREVVSVKPSILSTSYKVGPANPKKRKSRAFEKEESGEEDEEEKEEAVRRSSRKKRSSARSRGFNQEDN